MDETLAEFLIKLGFKVDDSSATKATETVSKLKSTLTKALGVIGITLSITKVAEFVSDSIEAASTAEQMQQKFDAVFTGMEDSADEWAESFADSIGRSKNDIKTYMADIQNLLVGMGMEREAGAELTEQMIEAAINIASFNNIDDETAVNAMQKALLGQSESAKTLGAVLNDNTLATAMQTLGLEGEFSALDEVTKMQVRYQAIVNQSADAMREENGVVGDAALSMDSYESKLRSFTAILDDIKINVGTAILPLATKVLNFGTSAMSAVRDFTEDLIDLTEEGGVLSDILDVISTAFDGLWSILKWIGTTVSNVVNAFGGLNNFLKLIAGTLGVLAAFKILSSISNIGTGISGLIGLVGKLNLKMLALVAVAAAIFLIIEDLWTFMQGGDSLIGSMIEANGGDADELRDTLTSAFDAITEAIDTIKQAFEEMSPALEEAWGVVGPILSAFAEVSFAAVIGTIVGLCEAVGPLIDLITDLATAIAQFLTGDWDGMFESLGQAWEDFVETITGFVDGLLTTLDNMLGTNLAEDMGTWATDAIQGFVDGLSGFAEKVSSALSSGIQWISDNLGHSTPKEGPLAGDDEWGSDFIENFTSGIEDQQGALQAAINGAVNIVSSMGGTASPSSSAVASGTYNYITQNISYSNTFNGDTRSNQTEAAAQMKDAATDTTTYLANALAFGR